MAVSAEAEKLRATGVDLVDLGRGRATLRHAGAHQGSRRSRPSATISPATPRCAGTAELRDALIARHASDLGSNYKREECIAAPGGKAALFNAIQVLVEDDDEVILPVPYWVSFKDIVRYAGGKLVYVTTDEKQDFALTADMVERAITPRTKLIILNSPNNPTGAVMKPEHMTEVLRLANDRGIYVISDECYVRLNHTGRNFSAGSVHEVKERLVIIGSLSKTYAMTGWRLGYALGPAAVIAAMNKLQGQSTSNPSSIVQKAAVAALSGPQDCVAEMLAKYIILRDQVVEGLRSIPGITCATPNGAFYAYPNVSHYFGRGGMNSAADVGTPLAARRACRRGAGRGIWHAGPRADLVCDAPEDLARGLERMKKFFASV